MNQCAALIQPTTPEMLVSIQEHRQLKSYIAAGAPPGYMLVKPTSSLENFLRRCVELGFEINFV